MPARPISSATVSFGLVSVPVQLYSAAESSATVSFNLLHKKCGSRLKQQYFCQKDGEKVERDDMVKGFEFSKGQYVQFTKEELKALEEKGNNSINITEFVPLKHVDRIYLDKVYFLGPEKGGERAYKLLAAALQETGRAALGQYAARGKQYLILVRPMDGVLVMEQLHYQDEVRSAKEVPIPDVQVKDQELKLAVQLIEQGASEEFRPEAYSDTVNDYVTGEPGDFWSDPVLDNRYRISPALTFYPSEFSKIRLQYNYDHIEGTGSENSIWLQFEFLLGAH